MLVDNCAGPDADDLPALRSWLVGVDAHHGLHWRATESVRPSVAPVGGA